jgi:hypothetical protein
MDGLASLMQQAPQGQPQQTPQAPMPGMNPRLDNAVEVVNNDIENLNLDPRTEYALKVQEASDLLASAERNLAMKQPQPTPPEIVDQRKQQVQQRIQQGVAGLLQQLMPGMQQRGMQMAAMQNPRPPMQAGLPTQAAPNMARMMDGGIVGYQEGGEIYDDIGAMAALYKQASDKLYDPAATPEEKANAQRQIDMINAQAGSRIGQVRRRVAEMSGTMDMEMAGGGYVKRYAPGGPISEEDYLRAAIRQEDITDPALLALLQAIYAQESSSGRDTRESPSGARGPMQVMPGTYREMADEDWDPNDPLAQTRAGVRYARQGYAASQNDPRLTAAYYYGGPGGMRALMEGADRSDPDNPDYPTVRGYADDISARMQAAVGLDAANAVTQRTPYRTFSGEIPSARQIFEEGQKAAEAEESMLLPPGQNRQDQRIADRNRRKREQDTKRSIGEQFAGPMAGIMGGQPMLLPPGQNRQDQRIAALPDFDERRAAEDNEELRYFRENMGGIAGGGMGPGGIRLTQEGINNAVANLENQAQDAQRRANYYRDTGAPYSLVSSAEEEAQNLLDQAEFMRSQEPQRSFTSYRDYAEPETGPRLEGADTQPPIDTRVPEEVVAEAPNVADEFRFYDVVGDALTPNAELLTGDTTEPAPTEQDELSSRMREEILANLTPPDAAAAEARAMRAAGYSEEEIAARQRIRERQAELNRQLGEAETRDPKGQRLDRLIAFLQGAGGATSTAQALRGAGIGGMQERRRQEAEDLQFAENRRARELELLGLEQADIEQDRGIRVQAYEMAQDAINNQRSSFNQAIQSATQLVRGEKSDEIARQENVLREAANDLARLQYEATLGRYDQQDLREQAKIFLDTAKAMADNILSVFLPGQEGYAEAQARADAVLNEATSLIGGILGADPNAMSRLRQAASTAGEIDLAPEGQAAFDRNR